MKSTDYDMYEKVLLYNNFIISKKILKIILKL